MNSRIALPVLLLGLGLSSPASAQETPSPPPTARESTASNRADDAFAEFVSGGGTKLYLGLGTALPLLEDGGKLGRSRSARTLVVVGASLALTEGLKSLARERRPDGSDRDSFPSNHASAAFALATMRARFRPKQAPYWYAGATLIAASRVRLRRHYTHDVIAGALLGHLTARYVLKQWNDPESVELGLAPSGSPGLTLKVSF